MRIRISNDLIKQWELTSRRKGHYEVELIELGIEDCGGGLLHITARTPSGKAPVPPDMIKVGQALDREIVRLSTLLQTAGLKSEKVIDSLRTLEYISTTPRVRDLQIDNRVYYNGVMETPGKKDGK